ncbi:MAG: FAD-dependent thymidylate synthase [Candidatus Caenarcaniphilales bacterium]|nr:FAD-dependent thymidylate synthase [Candidatus Caenarcaniphilales bacterium]
MTSTAPTKLEAPINADFCLNDEIGFVALIQQNGNDAMIVNSARVSFGKQIREVGEKDKKLLRFLLEHHHGTPLEHTSLTYLVKCPLFVARQWHRHRVGISINEISGRYVEVTDEFYIPNEFRNQSKSNRQASIDSEFSTNQYQECRATYKGIVDESYKSYLKLLENGVAREQARGILPQCTYTQFYWTCNLRSLFHFVKLRDHQDAQWEIQQYAKVMLAQAKEFFPDTINIWEDLGRT